MNTANHFLVTAVRVHDNKPEAIFPSDLRPIRRPRWRVVIIGRVSQTPLITAVGVDRKNLEDPGFAFVPGKDELCAIGRPGGSVIAFAGRGETSLIAAVGIHHQDFAALAWPGVIGVPHKSDLCAVWGPDRRKVSR